MTDAILTASEAATQIVGLINSRASSPSKDEIEAILAKISGSPVHTSRIDTKDCALVAWDESVAAFLANGGDDDAERQAGDAIVAESEARWAIPARSWRDIALLAAMTIHWNAGPYPDCVTSGTPGRNMDERSLAFLVRGILDLTGLCFDADGRVVPPPSGETPWVRVGTSRSFVRSLD